MRRAGLRNGQGLAGFLLAALALGPVRADDNRPLYVELTETAARQVSVLWKLPTSVEARHMPELQPPGDCRTVGHTRQWSDTLGHWRKGSWACQDGLGGRSVTIAYPRANPGLATIARWRPPGREAITLALLPDRSRIEFPLASEPAGGFVHFVRLGFEHIWLGVDHLLFVGALIFVAGTPRRVLVTITGFTIAHSVTLLLAALDLVRLGARAVEAVIALSIAFLAVEIVKGPRDTLTWRQPVAVAASFGLLHGFGFAAVLREVGLPASGVAAALLGFNLGIEAGQIVFASLCFALLAGAAFLLRQRAWADACRVSAGYVIGAVACYWMIVRLAG